MWTQMQANHSFSLYGSKSIWPVGGRCWAWVLAAAFALLFAAHPASASVSPKGEVAGLKAKFVNVNGIRTRYYELGQGEPMVLIHGEGYSGHSSANFWSKNIPGLAKHFHVFALDRLGSGLTDNPKSDKDYTIHAEMAHIVEFIHTLNLGKVHLVGQSHGGGMSMFIAVEHPDVVRSIVIIDSITAAPLGPGVPPEQDPVLKCPSEPDIAHWKCRLSALSYKPDVAWDEEFWKAGEYMASLPKSQEAGKKVKAGAGESSGPTPASSPFNNWKRDILAKIQNDPNALNIPVLIIWGHDDHSVPLARGYALYDVIAAQNPRVRMLVVNRADHFDFRSYPEEYNSYIINYINRWEHQPAESASKLASKE